MSKEEFSAATHGEENQGAASARGGLARAALGIDRGVEGGAGRAPQAEDGARIRGSRVKRRGADPLHFLP